MVESYPFNSPAVNWSGRYLHCSIHYNTSTAAFTISFPSQEQQCVFVPYLLRLSPALPPGRQRSSTATRHTTSSSGSLLSPLLLQQQCCCPSRALPRHAKVVLSTWAAGEWLSQRHAFTHPFKSHSNYSRLETPDSHLHCCSCLNSLKPQTSPRSSARELL